MSKATFQALGTGDGWASDCRGHSAFLFTLKDSMLLLDCGEPVSRQLRAVGVHPDDLDGIVLSHLHCDHVGGFFMLMQGFWLDKRTRDLTVHLPAEGVEPVRRMLDAAYIFEELMTCALNFAPLQNAASFEVGSITVTPHPTTHLDQLKASFGEKYPAGFEAFSFVLENANTRIAHSADIGGLEDLKPLLTQPVDLLVCELAHVEPDELFAFLKDQPAGHIGQVAFTHLSRPYRADVEGMQTKAAAALGDLPHTFLNDGDVITL